VRLPVAVRRRGYRVAFGLLRVYWFMRRPTLHGVKCVLTDGELVLLVRHTYGHPGWDLPGGIARRGEPPLHTARREMREELGLALDDWALLGERFATNYHCRDSLHCFRAEVPSPRLVLDRAELDEARWFPRARLPADVTKHVPPILALLDGLGPSQPGIGPA
jgi:8-oxo-dGTP pyrophosphatase MutT (NUDIX family)